MEKTLAPGCEVTITDPAHEYYREEAEFQGINPRSGLASVYFFIDDRSEEIPLSSLSYCGRGILDLIR